MPPKTVNQQYGDPGSYRDASPAPQHNDQAALNDGQGAMTRQPSNLGALSGQNKAMTLPTNSFSSLVAPLHAQGAPADIGNGLTVDPSLLTRQSTNIAIEQPEDDTTAGVEHEPSIKQMAYKIGAYKEKLANIDKKEDAALRVLEESRKERSVALTEFWMLKAMHDEQFDIERTKLKLRGARMDDWEEADMSSDDDEDEELLGEA